jgi:hypothetical protein
MWEIIDDNGTVHSGSQEEMENAFDIMGNPDEHSKEDVENYGTDWDGDLKLVNIINVIR